ncbi:MAG: M23 family metallopeptidase [Treponema sp.]|nr:M23 family metallopeptidase [Treponema sp.]MCL2271738.1 M23 family metallopeptidase [Treponema sp.]
MGKLFKITLSAVFLVLLFSASISDKTDAMSWPSEDAALIRNFGSNDNGKPVLGMLFSGGTNILAAENGEIIFSRNSGDTASRLPSPLGAWTAVDHEDGLISIYSRYADDNTAISRHESFVQLGKTDILASSGSSGWSAQDGFYFTVYDRRERQWINPAMIITPAQAPGVQPASVRPPQILSVNFKNSQGQTEPSRVLIQGRYTVLVNAVSPVINPGVLLAPQKIICFVNGAEAASLNFEAISARDGVLMVYRNGLVPAKQVYSSSPAFEAAEIFFTRGQANLEIIVQDINGLSSTLAARIIVN